MEASLICQIRQLQASGFRGYLQLNFPGQGGKYVTRRITAPVTLPIEPDASLDSLSDKGTKLCQSE